MRVRPHTAPKENTLEDLKMEKRDCTMFTDEELFFIDWSKKDMIETFGLESPHTIYYFKVIEQVTNSGYQKMNFWKIGDAYWGIQACFNHKD